MSRETGAGGTYISLKLAEKLGYKCVDKEVINQIAQKMGKPSEELLPFDQNTYDRLTVFFQEALQSMALGGRVFHQFGLGPLDFSSLELFPPIPPGEHSINDYTILLKTVIRELAQRNNVIILGRGARHILEDLPDALHVRVIGSPEDRIQRVAEEQHIDRDKAADVVEQRDESARKFISDLFDCNWADPGQYHLTLNTSLIPIDTCVNLLLKVIEERSSA
jgi:cytidylate kinase